MYMPSIFNNSVFDNFDNWMDFSFPSFNQRLYGASSSQLMKTDVKETDKDYEVSIDLPGFKKEDVSLKLDGGYLTISASKGLEKDEKEKKDGKYIRRERYEGQCSRSFYVGDGVQAKDVNAKFEDGILKVSVPKAAPQVEGNNVIAIE